MIRFFQRLEYYTGIPLIPSTHMLTHEDRRRFVSRQDRVDSNTDTHGTTDLKPPSKPVTPQDSSADLVPEPLPSNSQAVEQSSRATLPDAHRPNTSENILVVQQYAISRGMEREHIDPESHSDKSTTQGAAMFERAHNFRIDNAPITNIGHQHITNNLYSNASTPSSSNVLIKPSQSLDNLKEFVSFSAVHDSSSQDPERRCHPGTRKKVLDKMRTWMDDPNAPERILWLHGPAGVGKSAIAQTISYSYDQDQIGATFFFFRSDPVRNDGNRLFPTLTWQLVLSVPTIKDRIGLSLEKHPDLPRKAIEVQFEQLITQPFLTISGESTEPTTRVIVIDGLDECSDVKLQRRILKIIGNAVAKPPFSLRFIISSRPEAHIEDFFTQFQDLTFEIDLANVEEAYRDVETYLTSEFARIAVEQGLNPEAWPGQDVIDTLVSQSSGQFVYASTTIKYVGDEYESAAARLNIILGLKLCTGKSPFAELDTLYTEILQRQPDQDFLREFLPVLAARSMLDGVKDRDLDDAMLLGLDENELRRKLRGMHSLLKFEPFLDIYHKSFLDFLDDPSRSGEYHVSKHFANRRYMQRITDLLVKAASKAMEQPDFHEGDHFKPRFANVTKQFPFPMELPINDLEEILRPLQMIQENLLQLPNMSVPWKPRACGECWTFYMIDGLLLHLACFQGTIHLQEPKYVGIRPLTATEQKQSIPQLDLDVSLSLLLANLRSVEFRLSLDEDTVGLVRALVRFDPTETAMKVRSIVDAQNLVELIFCLNKNDCFKSWFEAAAHNATQLAVAIYGRVPLLPQCLFLDSAGLDYYERTYQGKAVKVLGGSGRVGPDTFDIFMWGCLSNRNMGPLLGILSNLRQIMAAPENGDLSSWRNTNCEPSVSHILQIIFEVAKAVQYIHSLGIVLDLDAGPICLDFDNRVKILCSRFRPTDMCKGRSDYDDYFNDFTLEDDIYSFGLLFYRVLFNSGRYDEVTFDIRPEKPKISDNVWQLIQWCGAKDPKERPTIDQVVREMESWISLGQFTLPC